MTGKLVLVTFIMFRWILSIWLLAVAPVLKAQGGQLKFDHFPTNDGLPNPWIYSILQDHRGYMWFGTKNGLCRFDGRNYTNFVYGQPDSTGLPAYECSDLVLSADGDIWCINFPFLVSCDGSSLKLSISNRPDGKPWEMYTLNADSRGNFWGISNLNIYRFKPGKNGIITDVDSLAHIPTSQVNQMRFDQEGDLILATEDDNIYVFDTLTHELANYKIPLDETKVNWRNIIRCLKVDSKGRIWLGTYNYGLYLFDKHTGKFDNFLYDDDALLGKDIVSNMVRSIEETNFDGGEPEIWLGTYDKGLVKFDPLTKTFTIFGHDPEKPTSLRNNNLRSLYSTSDALWIGTSNGIDKYDCRNQQYQTTYLPEMLDDELRKSVYSVCVDWNYTDNHKIWYGSNGGGLYYLDTRTMQSYSSCANPPDQMKYVHGILPWSADTLLCCGYFGVFTYHIPTDTWKLLPSTAFSTNNKEVIDESTTRALGMVRTGPDEFIFTSNYFGVWRCNMKTGKTEPVNDMQRQSKSAEMLPDQRIAVTQGGLLAILNPDGRVDLLQSRDSTDEFLNGNLYNVSHDPFRNCLWVTSWTGLGTIDLVTGARRSYTAVDGVIHRRSFDAKVDADGNVWVLCDGGLSYLRTGQSRFESIRLENITELPLAEVPELAITPDQQLAITLFNGMALIDLKRVLNPIRSSQRVEVSAYRSGNSQWDYHPADKLVFGHDQNTLEFILSCLSYTDPTRNTFSYMLDELHDGWVELDHLNRINLVNLEPGTYHLRVRSRDVYGALSENEHTIELVIEPAWYQTLGFSAFIIMMSLFVIYLIYRYRVRQLLKVQRIRNNISRDLHDDIGATLSSVNITSSIIQKKSADEEMVELVRDMRQQIGEAQQSLDEIVWNVNPNNDTLDKLFARMRRYASDILDRAGLKYRIEMPESSHGLRLSIEQRRDLYLVFKEGVNNVAKHSGAEFAHIAISLNGKRLEMSIKDDGRGFDTRQKSDRNGLGNMRKRAEQLRGNLRVYSAPGRGTELKLEVAL